MVAGKRNTIIKNIFIYFASVMILLYTVLPIIWVVLTSFKTQGEIFANSMQILPTKPTLDNYREVFLKSVYGRYFINSILITLSSTTLVMFAATLSGYSFSSAFCYNRKNSLMVLIIIARMIPEIAIIIPMYFFIQKLGMFDTKTGITLMISAMAYPLATWLIKSFFDDIPHSLYDAAKIDGCKSNQILTKIVLPISGPSLSSTLIITFLTVWNSFLIPLTYAKTARAKTFPVAISELAFGEYGVSWGSLSALSVIAVIPMFILGVFAQKYIISGLTGGAEKG